MLKHPTGKLPLKAVWVFIGLLAATAVPGSPATAASAKAKQVLGIAELQLMLTQKMSKEALLVGLDIDRNANMQRLKASRELFARRLKGLRNGDVDLGLPATTNPEVLQAMAKAEALWPTLDAVISAGIASGTLSADQVGTIGDANLALLGAMTEAVHAYEEEVGGLLSSVLGVAIDLSSHQRVLTQEITKEALLVAYGGSRAAVHRKHLSEAIEHFEQSLKGLINGSPDLQVLAAPTPEIRAQLRKVERLWEDFLPLLGNVAQGGEAARDAIDRMNRDNLVLLEETNKAFFLYEAL